jgi:ATP-binding cassette subfamily B protein
VTDLRHLLGLLRGSLRLVALSAGLSLVQALLVIPIGLLLRYVFDDTIPHKQTGELVEIGVALVALALAAAALALWTRYLVLGATKRAVTELRARLLERLHTLPSSWADRHDAGLLHATVVQDSERIDVMLAAFAAQMVPAAILGAAIGAAMLVVEPMLSLLLFPAVPLAALVARWMGNVLRHRTQTWHGAFDRFSVRTQFALRARRLVRAYGTERSELDAARAELEHLSHAGRVMAWTGGAYVQANSVIAMVTAVALLVVGGTVVANGDTTLGSLVSFFALCALLRGQLSTAIAVVPDLIAGSESLRRLQPILHADEPEPYDGTAEPRDALPIALCDVSFSYGGRASVLRGASIEIRRGECVAITGENGAGKTTIANLVLGLYRPDSGAVRAGGVEYDELDVAALRRRFAVVAQDPVLFGGTIAENIAYGEPGADRARIVEAARQAMADEFVAALPDGYDTRVGDEGGLLAGGERQRIAIARALLRAPELLILDEPTTSLDRASINAVLDRLRSVGGDRAILVISHDSNVIGAADRVYRLSGGVVSGGEAVGGVEVDRPSGYLPAL